MGLPFHIGGQSAPAADSTLHNSYRGGGVGKGLLCAEVNVVRSRRLYPRALLTPFTDNVQLTGGDERAYTFAAKAQRNKGFQQIDVSFHLDDTPAQPAPGDTAPDETAGPGRPAGR